MQPVDNAELLRCDLRYHLAIQVDNKRVETIRRYNAILASCSTVKRVETNRTMSRLRVKIENKTPTVYHRTVLRLRVYVKFISQPFRIHAKHTGDNL